MPPFTWLRKASRIVALVSGITALATADVATALTEIAAGGLSFAANPLIVVDSQEVLITPAKVRVTYVLRNTDRNDTAMLTAFVLPILDAAAVSENDLALAANDPANFNAFLVVVDGQPIAPQLSQRALAVELDVTAELAASALPLFPFSPDQSRLIAELSDDIRTDYVERGLLKDDGADVLPAWTLKTVAHWKQRFSARQTVTIELTYRPLVGSTAYTAASLEPYKKAACVQPTTETRIAALPVEGGLGATLTSVHYSYLPGADALGPAKRFRLIIEMNDSATIVSSCSEGLKRTAPAQMDWTVSDYLPDEDYRVLFAR